MAARAGRFFPLFFFFELVVFLFFVWGEKKKTHRVFDGVKILLSFFKSEELGETVAVV